MKNNEFYVYVTNEGEVYQSPVTKRTSLMSIRPNAMRKYLNKRYSDGDIVGFKKIRIVEVNDD